MKRIVIACLLITAVINAHAQAIDCNNLSQLPGKLKVLRDSDQNMRLTLNEKMKTLHVPQDSATYMPMVRNMRVVDINDELFVSNLLDKCGWPQGLDVIQNNTILLVIDHGHADYIDKYLLMVYNAMQKGMVTKPDYATLKDRSLMYSGKKQLYGTQSYMDKFAHQIKIWPIENPDSLSERRVTMSLQPMNKYLESLKSAYGNAAVWDKDLTIEQAEKSYKVKRN